MTGLFGKPKEITASAIKLYNGLDGVGTITASYETMLVTLFYGKVAPSGNRCEIQGEDGYMTCLLYTSLARPFSQNIFF